MGPVLSEHVHFHGESLLILRTWLFEILRNQKGFIFLSVPFPVSGITEDFSLMKLFYHQRWRTSTLRKTDEVFLKRPAATCFLKVLFGFVGDGGHGSGRFQKGILITIILQPLSGLLYAVGWKTSFFLDEEGKTADEPGENAGNRRDRADHPPAW